MQILPLDQEVKGSFLVTVRVKLDEDEGPRHRDKLTGYTKDTYAQAFLAYGVSLANQIPEIESVYEYPIVGTNDKKWPDSNAIVWPQSNCAIITRS